MAQAEGFLIDPKGSLVERFGFSVATLGSVKKGQAVEAAGG